MADLYPKAVELVLRERRASSSFLQRSLAIDYNSAASLITRMERDGVISLMDGNGVRTVLIGKENNEDYRIEEGLLQAVSEFSRVYPVGSILDFEVTMPSEKRVGGFLAPRVGAFFVNPNIYDYVSDTRKTYSPGEHVLVKIEDYPFHRYIVKVSVVDQPPLVSNEPYKTSDIYQSAEICPSLYDEIEVEIDECLSEPRKHRKEKKERQQVKAFYDTPAKSPRRSWFTLFGKPEEKRIGSVSHSGGTFHVYDEKGRRIRSLSTSPTARLEGYTSQTFAIRVGPTVSVYDINGRRISSRTGG